jgi:hypothetical protein
MPIGSAASLPLPQVPLSPSQFARRPQGVGPVPGAWGATAPPRQLSVQTAADDPPRGRVLLVSQDPATVLEMQRVLRDVGYRALGPAGSMEEAERLVARRVRHGCAIDCALVDLSLPDAGRLAGMLADEDISFVWLAPRAGAVVLPAHAPILRAPLDRDALANAIEAALRSGPAGRSAYPLPPPQRAWPRVFPQL